MRKKAIKAVEALDPAEGLKGTKMNNAITQ